jgi:hypothetical protein
VKLDERLAGFGKCLENLEQARFEWQRGEMCHVLLQSPVRGSVRVLTTNVTASERCGTPAEMQKRQILDQRDIETTAIRTGEARNGASVIPRAEAFKLAPGY